MASFNWKDYGDADLWDRYLAFEALDPDARDAILKVNEFGEAYYEGARRLAEELEQPAPDRLEFLLDLLLHARSELVRMPPPLTFGRAPAFDGLIALRGSSSAGRAHSHLRCPRIFVSHRQPDYPAALSIAKIATEGGFQFWLDVLDPTLARLNAAGTQTLGARGRQLLIAVIIEMALLHCTHVIAVITRNTAGSAWVPYEYGRVKDSSVHSLQAGCWIHPALAGVSWEYMLLGVETRSDQEIRRWLSRELRAWNYRFGLVCPDAVNDWRDKWGIPKPLPTR